MLVAPASRSSRPPCARRPLGSPGPTRSRSRCAGAVSGVLGFFAATVLVMAPVTVASESGTGRRSTPAATETRDRAVPGRERREHPDRLAGRSAGVGRERPGRTAEPPGEGPVPPASPVPQEERTLRGDVSPVPSGRPDVALPPPSAARPEGSAEALPPSGPAVPSAPAATPTGPSASAPSGRGTAEQPAGRMLRVLPLGTGLVLMGIGLGFIGLRLRRR